MQLLGMGPEEPGAIGLVGEGRAPIPAGLSSL